MKSNLVIREDASESILKVLIWSVFSLLGTRLFLKIMSYPEIGRGVWHVSHAATGGVIMIIGVIFLLIFAGKKAKSISLVIFGLGTGLFVDEIGKYLSRDYNYFFRPAIIFIYVFFVSLFLVYKYLKRFIPKDNKAVFYSILDRMEEIADDDLEKNEKRIIESKLKKIIKSEPTGTIKTMSMGMLNSIQKISAKSDRNRKEWRKQVGKLLQTSYDKLFRRKLIVVGLWGYSIYYAVDKLKDILMISTSRQKMMMIEKYYRDFDFFGKSDIYMVVGQMIFEVLASLLFLLGARYFWSKKRLRGIRFFKYGLYISILLGSIFRFYFEQFGAITDLLVGVILLEMLNEYKKELIKK